MKFNRLFFIFLISIVPLYAMNETTVVIQLDKETESSFTQYPDDSFELLVKANNQEFRAKGFYKTNGEKQIEALTDNIDDTSTANTLSYSLLEGKIKLRITSDSVTFKYKDEFHIFDKLHGSYHSDEGTVHYKKKVLKEES